MTLPEGFTLITLTGPTGSGKSAVAVGLARHLGCHIISADSRQIYKGIPIGTAAPTREQLAVVPHHFVGALELDDYYSAAQFESDVMALLPELARESRYAVMCGGSMMYVDAVNRGIDELPTISAQTRCRAAAIFSEEGREGVIARLRVLDPAYLDTVDLNNHKRLVHALEICMEACRPYSELRTGQTKSRHFRRVMLATTLPRELLFDRINRRVDAMIAEGLEDEARAVYHLRHLNSLNTVGYKEMFAMIDGTMDRTTAIERMKKNTRVYAKKQLTWLKKRPEYTLIEPTLDAALRALDVVAQSSE